MMRESHIASKKIVVGENTNNGGELIERGFYDRYDQEDFYFPDPMVFFYNYQIKEILFIIKILRICVLFPKAFTYHQIFASCGINIKAFPAFNTQPAGRHHIYQQGTSCIFRMAKSILQHP
jgi:hypothetical protein